MLQPQYVTGCVHFQGKKERKALWKQLRKELGDQVILKREGDFIIYKYREIV